MTVTAETTSTRDTAGRVVRVTGPVVDVEFPAARCPAFQRPARRHRFGALAKTLTPRSPSTSATTWCAPSRCSPPTDLSAAWLSPTPALRSRFRSVMASGPCLQRTGPLPR